MMGLLLGVALAAIAVFAVAAGGPGDIPLSRRPSLERDLVTATGNARRSLLFVLGRSYAQTSSSAARSGDAALGNAELSRSYDRLKELHDGMGENPPPHLVFELAKLFGFVARKVGSYEAAAASYGEVMRHDLHMATHPESFRCADPAAINYNGNAGRGVGTDCVLPSRLRYYGQLVVILERQLGRAESAERAFASLAASAAAVRRSPAGFHLARRPAYGAELSKPVMRRACCV